MSKQKENPFHQGLGLAIFVFLAVAVFLLLPGMVIVSLFADIAAPSMHASQLWTFSVIISIGVFLGLLPVARSLSRAGVVYFGLCIVSGLLYALFAYGFEMKGVQNWSARFLSKERSKDAPAGGATVNVSAEPQAAVTDSGTNSDKSFLAPSNVPEPAELEPEVRVAEPANVLRPQVPTYAVSDVLAGDTLNMRSGPGVTYEKVFEIPNQATGIRIVGNTVMNGPTEWVQVSYGAHSGWVTKSHLKLASQ